MLNLDRHRKKLIDGIVIAMGKPSSSDTHRMPDGSSMKNSDMEEGSPNEEAAETPEDENTEDLQFAKDAARALGQEDMTDEDAKAFAEAVKSICK